MDKDFYISAYKDVSKMVLAVMFATIVISTYLVQRSFQLNANITDKIKNFEDQTTLTELVNDSLRVEQMQQMGLEINYGTLSILWPVILLSLFIIIFFLVRKRSAIFYDFKEQHADVKLSQLRLNATSLMFTNGTAQKIIFFFLFFLIPITGLVFHAYSGYHMNEVIDLVVGKEISKTAEKTPENINELRKLKGQLMLLFRLQTILSLSALVLVFIINMNTAKRMKRSNAFALIR